jgi:hypothetical protein
MKRKPFVCSICGHISLGIFVLVMLAVGPAEAQIQPGPNISPNGFRFTFSPRAGYIGPPVAIFRAPSYLNGPVPYDAPPSPYAYGPPVPPSYAPHALEPRLAVPPRQADRSSERPAVPKGRGLRSAPPPPVPGAPFERTPEDD